MTHHPEPFLLQNLNEEQKRAVIAWGNPVLALSGAGTGKTRVIAHKFAYLVQERKISPYSILAVTFTNKAAKEMKSRVLELLEYVYSVGEKDFQGSFICTYHVLGVRILRGNSHLVERTEKFSIIDNKEQKECLRKIVQDLQLEEMQSKIAPLYNFIRYFKKEMDYVDYQGLLKAHTEEERLPYLQELGLEDEIFLNQEDFWKALRAYEQVLRRMDTVDFDDLIMLPLYLLKQFEGIRQKWEQRFRYILVDEFQDSNLKQYEIIKLLSRDSKNKVMVVGDDDQSIYGFRGSVPHIFSLFQEEFPNCDIIKLEMNYRSTKQILNIANEIIQNNQYRLGKQLRTEVEGALPLLWSVENDEAQAEYIAQDILMNKNNPGSKAILYRTHAQSRVLELVFARFGVPYEIVGNLDFYDRQEIKNLTAYLKLIYHPKDDISFLRTTQFPKQEGLGPTTLDKLQRCANELNQSLYETVISVLKDPHLMNVRPQIKNQWQRYVDIIEEMRQLVQEQPQKLLATLLPRLGFDEALKDKYDNYLERRENIEEFIRAYENFFAEEADVSYEDFMEQLSLLDSSHSPQTQGKQMEPVYCMSIHGCKGLEFDTVYFVGVAEGIIPDHRAYSQESLEEERRLFYVAVTRAKKILHIFYPETIQIQGRTEYYPISRFVDEINPDHVEHRDFI